jgi:hypothetical protein
MKNKSIILGFALLTVPAVAFGALDKVKTLLKTDLPEIFKSSIWLVGALAMLFFFWGVAQFILHSSDDKTREDGKKKMLWGVIALFVLFSINGIISVLGDTLDIPLG